MRSLLFALPLLFCLVGCGDPLVPVSGKVTLDDKPLANASVVFEPISTSGKAGVSSHGKTDTNGEFSLSSATSDTKGAVVGKHRIRITAFDKDAPASNADSSKVPKQLVPEKYNSKSEEFFEVPAGGTKDANFNLKSK